MQIICLMILLLLELAKGDSDVDVLLELKKGIQKDPSGKVFVSWNSSSLASDGCPQNWYGISCSEGSVTSITLNDLGLVGEFDFPAIAGLKMLQNLSVSNNQLTGSITEQVGSIGTLEVLDVSRNLFNGSLPSELTNLTNLVLLNLSSNSFEDTVPSSFGNLEQLMYLDLQSNGFTGDVMDLLSQLGSVVYVDLSSNRFNGSLDLGLGNLSFVSAIQHLNISHNSLAGELFSHDGMPYFDSLEVFDASNNQFVGNVPSFNFMVSLQILRLGSNHLSGSLPEALLQESSMVLSELDLSLNQLEGPVGSITSVTLKSLNLSSNKLSGPLPTKVGHCAIIDLSNNLFSGNLSTIQTWGNYVEIIELSSNLLMGSLPNQTSQFLRLTSFKISNNSIEGVLQPVLGTYPELKVIDFSLNQLNGILLPSFFNSSRLTVLNLSYNNFTGPIPLQPFPNTSFVDSIQNLSLVSLDLSHNSLTGHLPPEIGNFHNLAYLDLSNNHFEGGIPNDLPDGLKIFNVSSNNFSGIVPENLLKFPDSSFHPGNSLLIFPYPPSSPTHVPNLTSRGHRPHMKSATRAALIAGLVGGASIIMLVALVIHYRTHSKGIDERKGTQQEISSQNVDPSTSSQLASSLHEQRETSSVVQRPKGLGLPESIMKNEGLASSSTNPLPSKNQDLSDNPGSLKVFSPDKLAGDLHLFDGSLVFTAEEFSCAPAEVIGRSCHGTLYKAVLDSGHVLVVKWLKEGMTKGKKEFAREAKKLGNIKHPNLVSLQGYYWGPKEHEKLIVSNYINAPCLAAYLYETDSEKLPLLSLDERLKIAVDVACCLNYLHNERAIPHGNLKSTNILIGTPGANALLTDYSLHRLMTPAGTAEQVLNAGALGYRPPEFASTSKPMPSLKSDVYAFGVILLELLTGRSSAEIISGNPGAVDLTEWVRSLDAENRSIECFDKRVLGAHNVDQPRRDLHDLLRVGLRCILPASERPDMKTVFEDLSSIVLEHATAR
ncbi:probable inactive receptor kinase At5g10020 [Camellia sinensis]|uniref:probable inactive receptor kinase At5g10020 n=1 Tax=Camellia sinensis TaxID=4442 RepID=UPI0010365F9D|nr:probable inactive receptor kinase At5g10020 [Camellia sinensis]XP_028078769.1 probable inactive receptor kinase At5g10020 [Camellia sinensis]